MRNRIILRGQGVGTGNAKGKAQIIVSEIELAKVKENSILVVKEIRPHWFPIFFRISGLITEEGGLISHAAIAAREFGIPCVVGVKSATSKIKDDMLLYIDGAEGVVFQ